MSIDSIGPATAGTSSAQPGRTQAAQDFAALAQALQQGDLAAAQQAFSTLSQDVPWVGRLASGQLPSGTNSTAATTGAGPVTSAIQNLAGALQSGDLADAQKAFAALQQAQGGHHHGHHHHQANAQAPSSTTAAPPSTAGSAVDTRA